MRNLTDRIAVSQDGKIWRRSYQIIRSDGHVMSFPEKEYKVSLDRGGYQIFMNQRVNYKVHRVVASLFIPNPKGLPEVNHINGIKTDNRVENLEWSSRSDNIQHSFDILKRSRKRKLTDSEILEIFHLRNVDRLPLKEIASMYNVHKGTISHISLGNRYILKGEHDVKEEGRDLEADEQE